MATFHASGRFSSFGLDSRLLDFEATGGPALDVGGADPAPAAPPAADPTPAAPAAAPAPAGQPALPGQMYVSPAEMQAYFRDTLEEILSDPGPQGQQGPPQQGAAVPGQDQLPPYDPYDPQSVMAHLRAGLGDVVQQALDQHMAPIRDFMAPIAEQRGRDAANAAFDQLEPQVGKFDRDQATNRAMFLLGQGLTPNQALVRAAQEQAAFEQQFRAQILAEATNPLANMNDPANGAPPGAPAGETVTVPTGPNRYKIQLERSKAQLGLVNGVSVPTG